MENHIARRSRLPWVVVLVLLFAISAGIWYLAHAHGQVYKFRFYMPDGYVFYETEKWEETEKSGRNTDRYKVRVRTKYRVKRAKLGYVITQRPVSVKALTNGKQDHSFEAMLTVERTLHVDLRGMLVSVDLEPSYEDDVRAALAKQGEPADRETLDDYHTFAVNYARADWQHLVSGFSGRKVRVGDWWQSSGPALLPDQTFAEIPVTYRVVGEVVRNKQRCLIVSYACSWGPEEVQRMADRRPNASDAHLKFHRFAEKGEMIVSPNGIRVLSDTGHDELDAEVWGERCVSSSEGTTAFEYPHNKLARSPSR